MFVGRPGCASSVTDSCAKSEGSQHSVGAGGLGLGCGGPSFGDGYHSNPSVSSQQAANAIRALISHITIKHML